MRNESRCVLHYVAMSFVSPPSYAICYPRHFKSLLLFVLVLKLKLEAEPAFGFSFRPHARLHVPTITHRALVMHLDGISKEEITELNVPTATPLCYELTEDMKPIPHPDAIAPLTARYIGDVAAIRARIEGVKNQTK